MKKKEMKLISKIQICPKLTYQQIEEESDDERVEEYDIPMIVHTASDDLNEEDSLELLVFDTKNYCILPLTGWHCGNDCTSFSYQDGRAAIANSEGIVTVAQYDQMTFLDQDNPIKKLTQKTDDTIIEIWELMSGEIIFFTLSGENFFIDEKSIPLKFKEILAVHQSLNSRDLFIVVSEEFKAKIFLKEKFLKELQLDSCVIFFSNTNPKNVIYIDLQGVVKALDIEKDEVLFEGKAIEFEGVENAGATHYEDVYWATTNTGRLILFKFNSEGLNLLLNKELAPLVQDNKYLPLSCCQSWSHFLFIGSSQVIVFDIEDLVGQSRLLKN